MDEISFQIQVFQNIKSIIIKKLHAHDPQNPTRKHSGKFSGKFLIIKFVTI